MATSSTINNGPENTTTLDSIPVADNLVSESMLKSLLLTLQKYSHKELQLSLPQIHDKVDCQEERTDMLEKHVGEYTKAHTELLDAHDHYTEEIQHNKLKLADLEDHFRYNKIKFRGIPESVTAFYHVVSMPFL